MYAEYLDLSQPLAWIAGQLLTEEECRGFVTRASHPCLESAPVTTQMGEEVRPGIRNNTRLIFFDTDLASALWPRLERHVPHLLRGHTAVGVNECFRLYRYESGQHHYAHWDTPIQLVDGRVNLLTLVMYLNDEFEGGSTIFPQLGLRFTPVRGQALLFQQRVLHEAEDVTVGVKFVLRSEIFYRPIASQEIGA